MKKFFIMMLLFSTNAFSASIGDVILQEGNSVVERKEGDEFESKKDLDIFSYDTVRTGKGKTAIEFVDDTRVDVTEHSKLVIDEFVYDPNTKTGALSLKASLGTVRYASGQIAKNSKQNVKIKTPTATIGVRGTDFTMTIDETGSSTIILLPSCDTNGNCYVGEIDVTSDAGQVIMNQAFQATVVETVASNPMKPVILDLFCGTGTIAQMIAQKKNNVKVIGVDIVSSAIENAKKSAKKNQINNVEFYTLDIGDFLFEHPDLKDKIHTVIVDPPRPGVSKKSLKKIINLNCDHIIYVSCNPSTQARDIKILMEHGYIIKKFSIADQFPHTHHIETIFMLVKSLDNVS